LATFVSFTDQIEILLTFRFSGQKVASTEPNGTELEIKPIFWKISIIYANACRFISTSGLLYIFSFSLCVIFFLISRECYFSSALNTKALPSPAYVSL